MSFTDNQGSDIFIVQTLYDGTWRCDKKHINADLAQHHAALLVPDWGQQRVRILLGEYEIDLGRRHYSILDLEPPKPAYKRIFKHLQVSGHRISRALHSRIAASAVIAFLCVGVSLIGVSALTSSPSKASSEQDNANSPSYGPASAKVTVARSLMSIFSDISASKYAEAVSLKGVPLRLQGAWGNKCASGVHDLEFFENMMSEFNGAMAKDTALSAVFQAGQTYGLVTKQGPVRVLELVSIDQIEFIGSLSKNGDYTAATEVTSLQRCL